MTRRTLGLRRCGLEGVNFRHDARPEGQVKNGRLVLDEPTDLPEGEVVYLQLAEGIVPVDGDDMSVEDRAALHEELGASLEEADAGQTEDFGKTVRRVLLPKTITICTTGTVPNVTS